MITSERLDRLDLKIHKVDKKNVSLSIGMSPTTEKIISRKYITLTSNMRFEPGCKFNPGNFAWPTTVCFIIGNSTSEKDTALIWG
jgi:hypothetical protein